ncbi:MAG: FimB/Mfa2 family fimbrial subunit [Tannerella sp.]|nr:FimB/Mfa2 family fimbrial subunit [Tannerella sp.]
MIRYKLLVLPVLCLMIFMQSCVHGDLEECPPMVSYAVAFKYTNHTGTTDRFYDDVKKINLYVFDENNLIYTTTTELSPYDTNFNIPLDIPMGNYHIIAWGNVLDDQPFSVTPAEFVKGETTLGEARFILERIAGNLSQSELEKLFYGEIEAEIPLYVSRIDTMSLINDTKRVRVVLHWDHTGEVRETEDVIDYDEVQVSMKGSNAVYNFRNNFVETNNVTYKPYYFDYTGGILATGPERPGEMTVYYYSDAFTEVTNTCVYDFTILRMMTGSPVTLTIERKKKAVSDPYGLVTVDIIESFIHYFNENGFSTSDRQNLFDKHDYYRVDFYFNYDKLAGTYVTGGIKVLDWTVIKQPGTPGAD